jgi:hypothetical protein
MYALVDDFAERSEDEVGPDEAEDDFNGSFYGNLVSAEHE